MPKKIMIKKQVMMKTIKFQIAMKLKQKISIGKNLLTAMLSPNPNRSRFFLRKKEVFAFNTQTIAKYKISGAFLLPLVIFVLGMTSQLFSQQTEVYRETFDNKTNIAVNTNGAFSHCASSSTWGNNDIFDVTNSANIINGTVGFTNATGYVFAMCDQDACDVDNSYIVISMLVPADNNGLITFSGNFASMGGSLDAGDNFIVAVSTDGGSNYTNKITFTQNSATTYSDGTTLPTRAFTNRQFDIGSGLASVTIKIKVTFSTGGQTDEGVGLDEFILLHTPPAATQYYSKSTGDLNSLSNWGTSTDGSGANPASFTADNQWFNVRNNAAPTIGAAWTVSGTTSKIILGDGTNACNFTIPSDYALTGTIDIATNGTLTIANSTIPTLGSLATGSTVNYSGGAQSVTAATYHNLILSGSGTKTLPAGLTTISNNLTTSGTIDATAAANMTVGGAFTVGSGTSFTTGTASNYTFGVTGATSVTGTLTHSGTGARTFTGDVTINSGGAWNETGVATYAMAGSLQNDGTFTANTGVHTFSGASKTIGGSSPNIIGSVTFTGAYANSGTLTVGTALTITGVTLTNNGTITATTALSGTGGLTQGNGSTLNLGGSSGITTLTASVNSNTVNYTGTSQTLKVITYHHLTLSGGAETFGAITTINGNLTLSGTATGTTAAALAIGGTLTIGTGTTFTIGSSFTLGVTGATNVTGTFTLGGTSTKTFTGDVTLNSGATWDETANSSINIAGNFTNNASSFSASSTGVHTFSGTTKIIGGSTANVIPKATFTGAYSNSGTLTVATLLTVTTVTLTNNGTITATAALSGTGGVTQGSGSTLNIGGTSGITSLDASVNSNQVNYTGAAQTIHGGTYYNVTFTGAGHKTLSATTIVTGACAVNIDEPFEFQIGAFTLELNGSWSNANTSKSLVGANTSTLIIGGSSKTLPSSLSLLLNLTLNAGTTTLSSKLTLGTSSTGVLALSGGIVTNSATDSITILNTNSTAVTGGSSTSYVNGPLKWNIAASKTYIFPVGSSTNTTGPYYPFTLITTTVGGTTPAVKIQAFTTATSGTKPVADCDLSTTEFWKLTLTSTSGTAAMNSTVSLGRTVSLNGLDKIASCATETGTYTDLGGTASTPAINNSTTATTASAFFKMAQSACLPTITTTVAASVITATTASSGGQTIISGSQSSTITHKGVCWNTTGTPTTADSKTDDGTGTANFTSSITGLTASTLYYVRAYVTNSASVTAYGNEVTFHSLPAPTFTVQPGASACVGTEVTYTTQAGKTNYAWVVPGVEDTDYTIRSGGIGNASNTVTLEWLTTGSKTVTINYTDQYDHSAASPTSSTATTVYALPTPTFSAEAAATSCVGVNVTYTTQASKSSYVWGFPGTAEVNYHIVSGGTGADNSVTLYYITTGSKVVTVNYAENGCSAALATSSNSTTVNGLPTPTFTLEAAAGVCAGANVTYTTQADKSTYVWGFPGVAETDYHIVSGGTGADNSVTLYYITAGSKTVTINYTDGNGCTAASPVSSTATTVTAIPTPTFSAEAGASACKGVDVIYTTQSGKSNYTWVVPGVLDTDYSITSGGVGTSSETVTLKWLTTGSKTVTINYSVNGCTAASPTSSTATTVQNLPTPSFTAQPGATACIAIDVTYTTEAGKSDYIWSVPGVLDTDYSISSGGVGTGSNTVTLKWLTAGNKVVTINYTDANSCTAASATSSTSTSVLALPTFTAQPGASACVGVDVTYTTQAAMTDYTWAGLGSLGVDYSITSGGVGTGSNTVTLKWLTTGAKTVTINYTDGNSCTAALPTSSAATTVNALPTPAFTAEPGAGPICAGVDATYTVDAGKSNYTWGGLGVLSTDYSITAGGVGTGSNTVTLKWLTGGAKAVTINYTDANGCTAALATSSVSTTVNAMPTPTFTAQPGATACLAADVTYTTQAGQSDYIWVVPGVLTTDYSITTGGVGTGSNTVTLKWLTTGSKTVTINYTNGNSCTALSATSSTASVVSADPTAPTAGSTSALACTGMTVSWSRGNGNKVLVVARQGGSPTAPTHSVSYTADADFTGSGTTIGTGKVVYAGTGTSVAVTGLTTATQYTYDIYEFSDPCFRYSDKIATSPTGTTTGTTPTISSVASQTANGTYGIGRAINIMVVFSENVTVTGTPELLLETGSTDRSAIYASGSDHDTLYFTYTIQEGDQSTDLNCQSTSPISGGSITATNCGASATLTVGATALSTASAIVIEGCATSPTITTPTSASVTYNSALLGGNITAVGCAYSTITERGIYYNTVDGFADGAGTKVSESGSYSTGVFTKSVTGLMFGTTYYYKAFATNSNGTAYTSQGTFATTAATSFPVTESFEAPTTTESFPGTTAKGSYAPSGWTVSSSAPDCGSNSARLGTGNTDKWLFAPAFTATAGKLYTLSYSGKYTDNTTSKAIYLCTAQTSGSADLATNYYSGSGNGGTYGTETATAWFCTTSGVYYFGFKISTGATYYCMLDCIEIAEATPATITWDGSEGTTWGTAGNWDLNRVPNATDKVVVPSGLANYPTTIPSGNYNEISVVHGGAGAVTISATSLTSHLTVSSSSPGNTITLNNAISVGGNVSIGATGSAATYNVNGAITAIGTCALGNNSANSTFNIAGAIATNGNVTIGQATGQTFNISAVDDFTPFLTGANTSSGMTLYGTYNYTGSGDQVLMPNTYMGNVSMSGSGNRYQLANMDFNGSLDIADVSYYPADHSSLTWGAGSTVSEGSNPGICPYDGTYKSQRWQTILFKADLNGATYGTDEMFAGDYLRSLSFYSTAASNSAFKNFTIKVGHTAATKYDDNGGFSFFTAPATTVFTAKDVNVTTGWNNHVFDQDFQWNGDSNIIVEITWNNVALGTTPGLCPIHYTAGAWGDDILLTISSNGNVTESVLGNNRNQRPNLLVNYIGTVHDINIAKNWTNTTGEYLSKQNTVTFDGSGTAQTIQTNESNFYNATFNNTAGFAISTDTCTVENTLTMTAGNFTTGANTLKLGISPTVRGTLTRTTGTIIGNFRRWFTNATVADVVFPVGTAAHYKPLTLSFTGAPTTGGAITAKYTSGNPGTNGKDLNASPIDDGGVSIKAIFTDGYWSATPTTLTGGTYSITVDGNGVGGVPDYTKLHLLKRHDATEDWAVVGAHVAATGTTSHPVLSRTGVTGFSDYVIGGESGSTLPIELLNFSASCENNKVKVSWTTSSELNNDYFTIERSQDMTDWVEVAKLNGAGNSNQVLRYAVYDEMPQGAVYYRLKQTDFDSKQTAFAPLSFASCEEGDSYLKLLTNPASDRIDMAYFTSEDEVVTVTVNNALGELLYTKLVQVEKGRNLVTIDATDFSYGLYLCSVKLDNGKRMVVKVMVSK